MSTGGSVTCANFKKRQLDHLIDVILEANSDDDHPARLIAGEYNATSVQDYINIDRTELDTMELTESDLNDVVHIPNVLKKCILSLKDFWKHWGDKSTKDWTMLTVDNFDDFLMDGTGPQTQPHPTSTNPTTTGTPMTPVDVHAITSALSAAMLTKSPPSCTDVFMKIKGCGDEVKPLKEAKQWNAWHQSFLSVPHSHDFMDITDPTYVQEPSDDDACLLFDAEQKHAFGILVSSIKEPSILPTLRKYSDPNVPDYGDAQMLYTDLVAHYTQGLSGRQRIEVLERELDEIHLDSKWSKTCESFFNFVDNKLKDHQGLAPDPAQYLESWYVNRLNRTIEPHVALYQYVVNHQMQADSIAKHLGTAPATSLSYESYVEMICTFCQTIDHTNHMAVQEKSRRKALQAEVNGGRNGNRGGRTGGRGRNSGRGGRRQPNQTECGCGKYHNWIPKEQFDNLDKERYQQLIRDRISRWEMQANTSSTNSAPTAAPTNSNPAAPPTQIQVSGASIAPETPSVLTGAVPSVVSPTSRFVSIAIVTPSRSSHGSTTATQMESGPNTLLHQLMSNASAQFPASTTSSYANNPVTTTFNGGNYQIRRMNYAYHLTRQALHLEYQGALVDSGANGGMAGSDSRVLATIPHVFVDITGVGGEVLQRLPIVQGASLIYTIDEGPIILIMSQYAHKPYSKSIHTKSQIEHLVGVVHDSAKSTGG